MNFVVLDTCSILHVLRGKDLGMKVVAEIEKIVNPTILISVVTKAELNSLKIRLEWGGSRSKNLNNYLESMICIDINGSDEDLLNAYALIDTFSQGKNTDNNGEKLKGSSKNMGKNDLWIAATAYLFECALITTDNDFTHLNTKLINVVTVN
ncbi:type II toxin-antitoxin system VapC family toxin [Chryseobacterium sp. MP_3.2]|uniref:type II toxin-antitoxin system VapC family toxin n=1 Tax=Chryseobacterium sp. MP_3.2 TaxID=3071712 RepID=UPI002E03F23C|nr:tRNA(fMet)-specific endonuclease VapC [Chryseobacterium sp. MP_3.2]